METDIFISYCWKDESVVNKIDNCFKKQGILLKRDKRNMENWTSIKQFMSSIRKCDYDILIISDNYLKSESCMYEILEVMKDDQFKNRIFTVILNNTNIYKIEDVAKYIKYWKERHEQYNKHISELNEESILRLKQRLKFIKSIENNIGDFLDIICDMKNASIINVNNIDNINDIVEEIKMKLLNKGLFKEIYEIDILKKQFNKHYDAKGDKIPIEIKDIKYITDKLISLQKSEYIQNFLSFAYEKETNYMMIEHIDTYNFWEYIMNSENCILRREFLEFIKDKEKSFFSFMLIKPEMLSFCDSDYIWKNITRENLKQLDCRIYSQHKNCFKLMFQLLKLDILKHDKKNIKRNIIFSSIREILKNDIDVNEYITTNATNEMKDFIESGFLEFLEKSLLEGYNGTSKTIIYSRENYYLIKFYLKNKIKKNEILIKNIKDAYIDANEGFFKEMMCNLIKNNADIYELIFGKNSK